jgi:hypothetical protein
VALSLFKNIPGIGEMILLNVVSTGENDEEIDANSPQRRRKSMISPGILPREA